MDEGYIKFQAQWQKAPPLPEKSLHDIITCRDILHQLGLIGVYPNGIGYGNISQRWQAGGGSTWDSEAREGQFVISGSATGHLQTLTPEHFTLVTQVNIELNKVWCKGPIIASSETMSHAVIYQHCPEVNTVIHVHDIKLWQALLHQMPTTDASATYGSPEMAYSIIQLLQNTDLLYHKIFVMEGHPEGIFVFGENLWLVTQRLSNLVNK